VAKFIKRTELDVNEVKEVNEFKSLMPTNNQYEELKKTVIKDGFLFPIIVNTNKEVIDGYTRLKIARELGMSRIPVDIYETNGREEELDMVVNLNIRRRQLSKDEIIMLIDKVHEMKKEIRTNSKSPQVIDMGDYIIVGDKKVPKLANMFPNERPNPEGNTRKYLFDNGGTGSTASDSNNSTSNETNWSSPAPISETSNETNWTARPPPGSTTKTTSVRHESREIKEELKRLVPDIEINEETIKKYLKVKEEAPWLVNYIGDKNKGKIGIEKAYDIYRLLKKKNLLDLNKRVPESDLNELITDKYGRKVLERDDLLRKILDKEVTVSQAISRIKSEEVHRKPEKEEKGDGLPLTRVEVYIPKTDLNSFYNMVPSVKELVDEKKISTEDAEKVYEIWRNMEAIFKQASLLWYNTVDKILERAGLSEKEREEVFYEFIKPYCRLFPKGEVFPKEVLEGEL